MAITYLSNRIADKADCTERPLAPPEALVGPVIMT